MEQFRVSQDVPIGKAQVSLAQLNERSREIFRQIVESYLATGEPVGSRPGLIPRHSGTVWTTYKIGENWRLGGGVNARDQLVCLDRAAVGTHDLDQHTREGCRHFEHDFVGLDIDEDVIGLDGFADFLFPLQQRGFGHGLRQLRDFDFNDGHGDFQNEKGSTLGAWS